MAQFTKVNGTTQPVFALDVANGSIAGTANVAAQGPVMLSGPQLQFFSLTANAALTNAGNVNGYLNNVLQAVQQTGTIAFYQAGATAGTINLAIYPSGAYTTATLVAAAQTANATGGLNIGIPTANVSATASFTNLA
jgi:hypothetical protein|tara:strand:- start:180 stop:590 length:411 start_codon:yes stop_codon:yes gene_type:complete